MPAGRFRGSFVLSLNNAPTAARPVGVQRLAVSSAALSQISAKMPAAGNVAVKELFDAATALHDSAKVSLDVERVT